MFVVNSRPTGLFIVLKLPYFPVHYEIVRYIDRGEVFAFFLLDLSSSIPQYSSLHSFTPLFCYRVCHPQASLLPLRPHLLLVCRFFQLTAALVLGPLDHKPRTSLSWQLLCGIDVYRRHVVDSSTVVPIALRHGAHLVKLLVRLTC